MIELLIDRLVPAALLTLAALMLAVLLFGSFVFFPIALHAEAECLRMGYPVARVTVGLERYCTTLDGAVTVKVIKP
jgi:hypothetical protein